MFDNPVVYVDIETTGGSYRNSRILEVAAIRVEGGEVVDEFSTLIDPETYIPRSITSLTGIVSGDVIGKPTFREIARDLADFMDEAIFVAHNVRFDYSFLKHEFAAVGIDFSPKLLCTVRLSRALYPMERGHSLAKLIERHNIPVAARHRALEDAKALLHFTKLAYQTHGAEVFNEALARQLKTQSLPPHIDVSIVQDIEDVPGVYIFRNEQKQPLYVGKSITLKKRVMSHFQSTSLKELRIAEQIHHIETIRTGSELAALLLESKLVKELQPIHNRLLRRQKQFAIVRSVPNSEGYTTLVTTLGNIEEGNEISEVYGIFKNRMQAKKKLEDLTKLFNLCPKLMGLEKGSGACFSYSLGRCKGACVGKESAELYNRRVEIALEKNKVASWQYDGAVTVPINQDGEQIIINNWIIEGYLDASGERVIHESDANFDIDEYKILYRFIRENTASVRPYSDYLMNGA